MQSEKIICPQCGAVIPPDAARCPYCKSAYAPGAEREYMRKLEQVRSDLDQTGHAGAEAAKREFRLVGRKITLTVGFILAFTAAIAGITLFMGIRKKRDRRQEYAWRQENIPELNRLFEEEKYDALVEAVNSAQEAGHDLYEWEHYAFVDILKCRGYMDSALRAREQGYFSAYDARDLLYNELCCRGASYRYGIPKEDLEKLRPLLSQYEGDLEEIFHASPEEIGEFDRMLEERDGYPEYDACREYVEAHEEIILTKDR